MCKKGAKKFAKIYAKNRVIFLQNFCIFQIEAAFSDHVKIPLYRHILTKTLLHQLLSTEIGTRNVLTYVLHGSFQIKIIYLYVILYYYLPAKVPVMAPIVQVANNNGEYKNTATFIKVEA